MIKIGKMAHWYNHHFLFQVSILDHMLYLVFMFLFSFNVKELVSFTCECVYFYFDPDIFDEYRPVIL